VKIEEMVRKEVFDLFPYEIDSPISRTLDERVVKLDLNENFAVGSDVIGRLLLEVSQNVDVRLYPPPYGALAVQAISRFSGFTRSEICVGNGADNLLDSLMKVFVKKGSKVLVVEPTFPMYTHFTQLYGGEEVAAMLEPNFELNANATLKKVEKETSLIILCSPNNPTGNQFNKEDIKKILQEFDGVVVIDETYADFAGCTLIDWVRKFGNLVVLKSYSKAFGLAGIRLGYLVSNKSTVKYVKRVTPPFGVNIVAQRFVALVLQNWNYFKERIEYVVTLQNKR
jgi:histidinol-phosphate aminotransferase